jgi:hypothetical protein
LGRKISIEGWISFESDPLLKKTRKRIYTRCAPCLENLLEQLEAGQKEITLGTAYHCWKVTAVLPDLDQCYAVLAKFDELFPNQELHGKLGGGKGHPTKALVFHVEEEERRDALLEMLRQCARQIDETIPVFISRGCANPYADILGPWQDWNEVSPVRHPEKTQQVIARLKWSLYERSNGVPAP